MKNVFDHVNEPQKASTAEGPLDHQVNNSTNLWMSDSFPGHPRASSIDQGEAAMVAGAEAVQGLLTKDNLAPAPNEYP